MNKRLRSWAISIALSLLIFFAILHFSKREDPQTQLSGIFGLQAGRASDGAAVFDPLLLEGRFGLDEWNATPFRVVQNEKVSISKNDADMQRGGGKVVAVTPIAESLELRITDADKLGGFEARWAIYQTEGGWKMAENLRKQAAASGAAECVVPDGANITRVPAGQPFHARLERAGLTAVVAELYKGDDRVGVLCTPLYARVNAHWTFESRIHPRYPLLDQEQQTETESADEFTAPAGVSKGSQGTESWNTKIIASTSYSGAWAPPQSHQIDLEVHARDGATGGVCLNAVRGPQTPPQDPSEAARHRVDSIIERPVGLVRVGGPTQACQDDEKRSATYANSDPVPYVVEISLVVARSN